jgi:hypothetical protein
MQAGMDRMRVGVDKGVGGEHGSHKRIHKRCVNGVRSWSWTDLRPQSDKPEAYSPRPKQRFTDTTAILILNPSRHPASGGL